MLHSILNFVMQLSLVYLLTAMFVILDLLLLSTRVRRLRREEADRDMRKTRRKVAEQQRRTAFQSRQPHLRATQ